MLRAFFLVLLTVPAYGQRLTFGVLGGTNITSGFQGRGDSYPGDTVNPPSYFRYLSGRRSLILGAMLEVGLTRGFSIEANVLERPMYSRILFTEFLPGGITRVSDLHFKAVRAWEFPVMLKYTLPPFRYGGRRVQPFLEAGPAFRTQENASSVEPSQLGITAGAGAAVHLGRIRIAPSLRYTRWKSESIYPKYATRPDQVEFLTSVAYQTEAGSVRVGGRRLEFGAVLGWSPTRAFSQRDLGGDVESERTRYLAGLTAQWRASRNLALEVDGIYKPLRVASQESTRATLFSVLTWQIPVLAKYGFTQRKWHPFAEAGPSFRLAGNLNGYNPSHYGVTAGAGFETRAYGVHVAPALRYTRWAKDQSLYGGPSGYNYPRTRQDSVELVVSFSF
jgi:hypothetical protein